MSLATNTLPVAAFGFFSLGIVFGIHEFSQADTEVQMQQIADADAARVVAQEEERAAFLTDWKKRKEESKKAEAVAAQAARVAALPGDASKGRMKYMICMACHGLKAEGNRAFRAPRLQGQQPWYIERQLKKFREGVRGKHPKDITGMQMAPMANILTPDAVDNVIAYIATIGRGQKADQSSGDAAAGQALYAVCSACHGPQAQGMKAQNAPQLSNQHDWYIKAQLRKFRDGIRGAHANDKEGVLMVAIAQTLTDDDVITNLIAYIQSLSK